MPFTLLPPPLTREDALTRRLEGLAARLRRSIVLREGSKLVVVSLAFVLAIALADQRWGLPSFVRALALVSFLTGLVLLVRRWLVRPLDGVGGLDTMAARIERRFPEFNDALLSAVHFLQQAPDAQTCSPSLRRMAIRRAVKKSERYNFELAIPTRGTKRWLAFGVLLMLAFAWLVQAYPATARAEWQRLTMPYGGTQPLAQTRIEILDPASPHRMARGESLDVKVRFHGVLPDRATLSIQFANAPAQEQSYPVPQGEGEATLETVFRIDSTRIPKSFQYRIRANDGVTAWHTVEVLPPPVFVPLDGRPSPQIHLDYPTYTDLPAEELPEGSGMIPCVAGTRVTIRAATDRPVHRAWIVWQPELAKLTHVPFLSMVGPKPPLSIPGFELLGREVWERVPVQLADGGRRLEVSFVPRMPGAYQFRFEDETGLGGQRTFDIQVKADPAPLVQLDEPNPKQEVLLLLADAEFTLHATVKDEQYAIRNTMIEYRTAATEAPRVLPGYDATLAGQVLPTLATRLHGPLPVPAPLARLRLREFQVKERYSLKQFRKADGSPLLEGDLLLLNVAAEDFDDVTGFKQPGRSATIVIQVVGKADLEAVQQQAQSDIRTELLQLLAQQKAAKDLVQGVQQQLTKTGMLNAEQREQLEQAEQLQKQIQSRLNNKTDGLREQLNNLRKLASDNRLPRSAVTERLNEAAAELDRLANEELEPLASDLAAARKADQKETQQNALTRTAKRQAEVEQTFKGLLERLEPWSGAGEVRGETRSVLGDVKRNLEQTAGLAEKLPPNTTPEQLTPQQRSDLERAALNDERAAERLRGLVEKINRLALEKEAAAQAKGDLAKQLAGQAQTTQQAAKQAPAGSPAQKNLQQQATELNEQAQAAQANAADLQREANALRQAAQAGNSEDLKEQLRSIAGLTRQNQLSRAQASQKAAVQNLERMLQAMEDQQSEDADRLTKSLKKTDQQLENLIDEQEKLQKKIRAAQKLTDPQERQAALETLTREQEKLEQQARELAQQLSRNQNEEAAQELRRAAREMAQAREQIEAGEPANKLNDALERLDQAQEQLDQQRANNDDALQREQAAKLADKIKALRDRQQRMLDESQRLHSIVIRDKKWERPLRASLNDLRQQQEGLAPEVRKLMDGDFAKTPVYQRMLRQAAEAMDLAAKRIDGRLDAAETGPFDVELEAIADRGIRSQQQLSLKRFDQLLDALKPDSPSAKAEAPPAMPPMPPPMGMNPPMPMGNRLPPLAELKALRGLQVDIAERTSAFAKEHPDLNKLNDDETAELDALMKMQVDVAELIKQLTANAEGANP